MAAPWAALPAGTDPDELYRRLASARERFLSTGRIGAPLRSVVADSWQRCRSLGLDPQTAQPRVDLSGAELEAYRAAHPLAAVMPVVRRLLVDDATDSGMIVAVADAQGRLLWVEGAARARSRAERMAFVPGAGWRESAVGTNAPGTALALDQAVQLYGCEHLSDPVTPWSCAAAPIHDPSGMLLGAIDLTGGDDVAAPQAFTLVRTAAAMIEAELRLAGLCQPPEPEPELAPEPARFGPLFRVLGRDRGELVTAARTVELSPRHTELLLLLAEHPAGLTAEELGVHLHERDGALVTLRAELSRLRALLGPLGEPRLASRPYRLASPLHTDVQLLRRLIERGEPARALRAYPGPVLPRSQAPTVAVLRTRLARDLRAALLAAGDPELLWSLAQRPEAADDLELWQACRDRFPPGSQRRAICAARLDGLHRELG